MKKISILFIALISAAIVSSCNGLFGTGDDLELTELEVISGLKNALIHGTDTAVSNLSVSDGYFKDEVVKILLPAEAQPIFDQVENVPLLGDLVDQTVLTINRAAEDAATEAKPIFIEAIAGMTIDDGWDILNGDDTAATAFLRRGTFTELHDAFQPKIETSLSKEIALGVSAEESYTKLIDTYNTASLNGLLFDKIKTNSLSEHATNKALSGLFVKVADEEKLIRKDPAHRVTDILEKVFAEQD